MDNTTIEKQIDFIRGARHLVAGKREVLITEQHAALLMKIEENLLAVKLYETTKEVSHA